MDGSTRLAGPAYAACVIEVDSERVRRHLAKLLVSEQLGKSETSRRLASYLVERALRNEVPKETEIALDVFGKDPSFSGAEQSIVRVSVRTLRQKLAEYYTGPGRDDELRFEIPKGGYRLIVTEREAPAPMGTTPGGALANAGIPPNLTMMASGTMSPGAAMSLNGTVVAAGGIPPRGSMAASAALAAGAALGTGTANPPGAAIATGAASPPSGAISADGSMAAGAGTTAGAPNLPNAATTASSPMPASGTAPPALTDAHPQLANAAKGSLDTAPRSRRLTWAMTAALMLLAASLLLNIYQWNNSQAAPADAALAQVRASTVWSDIVTSNRPVTIILGDLFMYTQIDPKTGRTVTVRDAGINSSEELRAFLASNPSFATDRGQRYVTMIQKTVAVGMASILRIVDRPGRHIEVAARDDVPVDEIRNNDIIYLGPLVRLGPLTGHYEVRSRYRYSAEGPAITDVSTGKVFLPEGALGGQHLDYALAAKFIGPTGNHILILTAGARNAGLLQVVRTLTSPEGLANVEQRLRAEIPGAKDSFEALLTVTGFKQTDLAADVVALHALPPVAPHLQKTASAGG